MSLIDSFMMGEPARLDYLIREHEKLTKRFDALADLLVKKGLLSPEEIERLIPEETEA